VAPRSAGSSCHYRQYAPSRAMRVTPPQVRGPRSRERARTTSFAAERDRGAFSPGEVVATLTAQSPGLRECRFPPIRHESR
jgi:hypothetical protein